MATNQQDDLFQLTSERIGGTCEWLVENPDFDHWMYSGESTIFWVRGAPAAGKTFLASYAIESLQEAGKLVCYYFFVKGDKGRASVTSFLQSMASQLATLVPEAEELIAKILWEEPELSSSGDYRGMWRKMWQYGILRLRVDPSVEVFWVIDSLDECRFDLELSKLLVRVRDCPFIKIFVTSRRAYDNYPVGSKNVKSFNIRMEDTQQDIAAYLDQQLPSAEPSVRDGILAKSNGCFLWATLVVRRLENVHGTQARLQAIDSEPPGMQDLYARIVQSLPNHQLSQTILTWIICSVRPMSLDQLHYVLLDLDGEYVDHAVQDLVSRNCHDLVYIDQNLHVRIRHASAQEFLTRRAVDREDFGFAIDRASGHRTLALGCLKYLTCAEMSAKSRRKMRVSRMTSPFALYATDCLWMHLNGSPAQDQDLVEKLAAFLKSENLLTWIAYCARKAKLETVLQTAQALKDFLRRKSKTDLLLGEEVVVIDKWATDLVKLVSKFGRALMSDPHSVYDLIPPFCPPESAPFQQFTGTPGAITVHGLSATTWDDCLCTVAPSRHSVGLHTGSSVSETPGSIRKASETAFQTERLTSIASTKKTFVIGTSLGRISMFNESTCLEERILEHGKSIRLLGFAMRKPILASADNRCIQIWDAQTWQLEWTVKISKECMDFAFVDDDQILLAALKNNSMLVINLRDREWRSVAWVKRLEDRYGHKFKARFPSAATFHAEMDTLAIVYRAQDLVLWNYEENTYQLYNHDTGLSDGKVEPMASVNSLVFSQSPGSFLLVASYSLGDLVLFDIRSRAMKATFPQAGVYFRLSSSPDGRTFAAAANDGTIELYDFETLRMIYRIRSEDQGITTLAFSHDSVRLYDIRGDGRSCRVWEPAALMRREIGNDSLRTPSVYSQDSQAGVLDRNDTGVATVTALACYGRGKFFVGKDDASVSLFETSMGSFVATIVSHASSVVRLEYIEAPSLLISVDTAGYLLIHSIYHADGKWRSRQVFDHHSSGTGIQHFLCNHDNSRILICANDQASVFAIAEGKALGAPVKCDSDVAYVWAKHPSNSDLVLLMYHHTIHLYSWKDPNRLTLEGVVTLAEQVDPGMRIRGVAPMFAGSMLGLIYSSHGTRRSPEFLGIQTSTLHSTSGEIKGIAEHQVVFDQIEYYIGPVRNREVFLSTSGWICSANEDTFSNSDDISYHFPPPSDWLRANDELIIRVTDGGDILFAWRGEVAVVKSGLDRDYNLKDTRDM
jgi:WD40 repeat protein